MRRRKCFKKDRCDTLEKCITLADKTREGEIEGERSCLPACILQAGVLCINLERGESE